MAGVRPFFITGANAKVRLNGKTLAFCTDLQYSVSILTQTPKILGMYEGSSVEPLGYSVSGSFTVIRYAKDAQANVGAVPPQGIATNDAGNGIGNWGAAWGGGLGSFLAANGVGNDGRPNEDLDPSKLANGTTFDIQVYQHIPSPAPVSQTIEAQVGNTLQNITNALTGSSTDTNGVLGVANIRNARITQADFQLTKKGAAIQRFNFVALYCDEDAFVANFSGIGQQNT
jgi:hypothetical protein